MENNRKRPYRVVVHFTKEELSKLNQMTLECGMKRESYIRSLILNVIPQPKPTEDFYEMIVQLRRIGTNLNQIALVANRTGSIDILRYKKDIESLNQSILEIRKKVLLPSEV